MTKKALVEYFALRLAMVNDIKRKAYDKLSQEIDDKPRQFIKGIAEVCEDVIKRTKALEGCA